MTNAWRIAERLMCAGVMPIFRERNNEEKAKKPASWQATMDENFASDTAYETGSSKSYHLGRAQTTRLCLRVYPQKQSIMHANVRGRTC
ncbi:hypothetical protein V3C99_000740 [Haemonchus contortus]